MTSAFIDVRTVLDMTWLRLPRAPRPTFADRPRVYFLWPVYTRQVLIRQRRRRRLNLFQEHVLRLARVGVTDAARVAALLVPAAYGPGNRPGLAGVPLVRRVQAELQLLRALDAGLRPTEGADEILADGESDQDDVTACFTFQDPWTGELWERFPDSLLPAMIEIRWEPREAGLFGVLAPESDGRPRQRGMIVRPSDSSGCRSPGREEIIRQFDRYAAAWRLHMGRSLDDADDDADDAADIEAVRGPGSVDEVLSIGAPEPALVQAVAFIPEAGGDVLPWEATDPFGLGISRQFRDRIDELRRSPAVAGFSAWLARRLDEERGDGPAVGQTLGEQAQWMVDMALHGAARSEREVQTELVTMQWTALRVQECLAAGERQEAAALVRLFFSTAGIALERSLRALRDRFATAGCYARYGLVPGDTRRTAHELNQVAIRLGFATDASGKLPDRFTHVDAKRIRRAADQGDTALNGMVWAAALTADGDPHHPLHRASRVAPDMLRDVAEIGRMRDETNHAVSRPEDYLSAVATAAQTVLATVRLLLAGDAA